MLCGPKCTHALSARVHAKVSQACVPACVPARVRACACVPACLRVNASMRNLVTARALATAGLRHNPCLLTYLPRG
eukprot:3789689-Alexandrium_andersonii.AAC.1